MLNSITIMGRLTKEPEMRYTNTQTAVCSFTLAVDRDFSGKDSDKKTDFIDCIAWRNTAEFVKKYFDKGQMAVVKGRLESNRWQDKEGKNRISWNVIVDGIYFGEAKRTGTAPVNIDPPDMEELGEEEGDLPF